MSRECCGGDEPIRVGFGLHSLSAVEAAETVSGAATAPPEEPLPPVEVEEFTP